METAELKVLTDIHLAVNAGDLSVFVLLNLSAVFETVDHGILLHRLDSSYQIVWSVQQWFQSYLSTRLQHVRVGSSASSPCSLLCGVLLGSVLGAFFSSVLWRPAAVALNEQLQVQQNNGRQIIITNYISGPWKSPPYGSCHLWPSPVDTAILDQRIFIHFWFQIVMGRSSDGLSTYIEYSQFRMWRHFRFTIRVSPSWTKEYLSRMGAAIFDQRIFIHFRFPIVMGRGSDGSSTRYWVFAVAVRWHSTSILLRHLLFCILVSPLKSHAP